MDKEQPYEIDQQSGTITYWIDRDTDQKETMSFADFFDLAFYLKRRELEIRQMVYRHAPVTIERPMMLVNGYYIGVTKDRQAVKIKASRYQEVMRLIEANTQRGWLELQEDRERIAAQTGGYRVANFKPFDNTGAVQEAPTREVWTEADTPDYLIHQEQEKLKSPEYWNTFRSGDNLDSGKYVKLP